MRGTPSSADDAPAVCAALTSPSTGECTDYFFNAEVTDVAVDESGIFWTTPSAVMKASPCGADVTTLASCSPLPNLIATATADVFVTTVEGESGHYSGTLVRVAKAGGQPQSLAAFPGQALGLGVADGVVFFSQSDVTGESGTVERVAATGGSRSTLFSGRIDSGLAIDDGFVYFGSNGAISKVRFDGSELQTLAEDQVIEAIAVDDTSVYWTDGCGSVRRIAKSGSFGVDLLSVGATCVAFAAPFLATGGGKVYVTFIDDAVIAHAARFDGANWKDLATAGPLPAAIAFGNGRAYWGTRGSLQALFEP